MQYGNRATLAAIKRKTVDVDIDGVAYRLREMSGTERDRFEVAAFKEDDKGNRKVDALYLRGRLVASCLVDEAGTRLFADDEIEQLSGMVPASALNTLFGAAQKLNGLDADAAADAAKNSAGGPTAGSGSGSPSL
jgi:hypothetical protein